MTENEKLSETILTVIADNKSYRMNLTDIRNSNAMKESFKNIDEAEIIFHIQMLIDDSFIDAEIRDKSTITSGVGYIVNIRGLTRKGNDRVKYIRSSWWNKTKHWVAIRLALLIPSLIYSVFKLFYWMTNKLTR